MMEASTKKQPFIRTTPNGLQPPLRVLEILGHATVGGMEVYVRNLIRHLPTDDFQVTLICPFESPFTTALRQMGCDVYIAPVEDDPRWRSIQLAIEVIRLHNIDIVHAHMPKAHVLAGLAARLTGIPAVATVHGMNITSHELGIWRAVSSTLVTVCQEAYTQALAMGVHPDRVHLIPNGVDVEMFHPDSDGSAFRASINVPADAPLVGFVGRLEWEKGPDQFLRAAEMVHRRRPDVYFALVGQGGMRNDLLNLAERLGIGDRVRFAGVRANMVDVYPAFDIVASSSRSEGMPLSILEAMACGRAVVALAVGGVTEIIESEGTGYIVSACDWENQSWRMLDLLDQPERITRMGQAARRRAEDMFDIRLSATRTADLFRQLVCGDIGRSRRPAEKMLAG